MGASLSTRFEWTTHDANSLQTSVQNQELLYELVSMIQQTCQKHPSEAKAEFKRPIVWQSSLTASAFSSSRIADLFVIQLPNSK
jgi:hypothetical protein